MEFQWECGTVSNYISRYFGVIGTQPPKRIGICFVFEAYFYRQSRNPVKFCFCPMLVHLDLIRIWEIPSILCFAQTWFAREMLAQSKNLNVDLLQPLSCLTSLFRQKKFLKVVSPHSKHFCVQWKYFAPNPWVFILAKLQDWKILLHWPTWEGQWYYGKHSFDFFYFYDSY